MTGRHVAPPVGSAARDATAQPYVGLHRTHVPDLAKQWRAEADAVWSGDRYPQDDSEVARRERAKVLRECADEISVGGHRSRTKRRTDAADGTAAEWTDASQGGGLASALKPISPGCGALTTYDEPPDDPPRCTGCGHREADECGCTCCTWTCDERPANV